MVHRHPFPWKAAAPSLALSAVLIAVTVCANSILLVSNRASDGSITRAMDGLDTMVELELGVAEMRYRLSDYIASGDGARLGEVNALRSTIKLRLTDTDIVLLTEEADDVVSDVLSAVVKLERRQIFLQSAVQSGNRDFARQLVDATLSDDLLNRVREQHRRAQAVLDSAGTDSLNMTIAASWLLLALGLSGAAVGIYAGYSRARALQQQMVELTISVNSAQGSLDNVGEQLDPIAIEPSEDLSHLQSMVDILVERVSNVVRRLQEAEREAIRRDQLASLGQLAAGLAHELRNPLTAIKTLVEAARGSSPHGTLDDRDMQVIEEELSRLDITLQSFLDFARPPKSTRREIDVCQLIQNTLHLLSSQLERLSIQVDSALPTDPVRLTADPEQLKQVLLNVMLNAVDAMGERGTLTVSLRQVTDGGFIKIDVDDTGPGISDSVRNRLFEPFVSSKPSGTGLGLTISRRIIESHGGRIDAENRAAGGARFSIMLPVDAARTTHDASSTAEQPSATSRESVETDNARHPLKMSPN